MGKVKQLFSNFRTIAIPNEKKRIQNAINRHLASNTTRSGTEPWSADQVYSWKKQYISGMPISEIAEVDKVSPHRVRGGITRQGSPIHGKFWTGLHKINKARQSAGARPLTLKEYQKHLES